VDGGGGEGGRCRRLRPVPGELERGERRRASGGERTHGRSCQADRIQSVKLDKVRGKIV
jgi:hypothetical protein